MPPSHPPDQPYTNASTSSVRRNLFSTHLSRRPASQPEPEFDSQPQSQQTHPQPLHYPRLSPISHQHHPSDFPPPNSFSPPPSTTAIIATHPNGRPLLPTLPHLPPHLRLSTTSSSDDLELGPSLSDHPSHSPHSPTRYAHPSQSPHQPHLPPEHDTDVTDRARIEQSLVEMMYRQRQRASATSANAAARRGDAREGEEEELMGLIMGCLREKVGEMEGEGWMFEGGGEGGLGVGVGAGGFSGGGLVD